MVSRVDRERQGRYIYGEQPLADSVWQSNTAVQNLLSERELSKETRAEMKERLANRKMQALLMDVVGLADTEQVLHSREAVNSCRTILGAAEPKLYVLFPLGVADTRLAASKQTARATLL